MRVWLQLAMLSAWSRRLPVTLVILAVAVASLLVLFVGQLRADLRTSFGQAVSGVDLLVAPRGSPTDILLYGVFQLGRPTQNLDAGQLQSIRSTPTVTSAAPGRTRRSRIESHAGRANSPALPTIKMTAKPTVVVAKSSFKEVSVIGSSKTFQRRARSR